MGTLGKILNFIDYPFQLIRLYTICPGDEEEYDHHYTVYWPIFGIPAFLFLTFGYPSKYWLFAVPVIFTLYYMFNKRTQQPKYKSNKIPSYFIILVLLNIVNGIMWTKLCSGLLVDLLTLVGTVTNLSTTYLGLTILAVGNALPDGLTTIAIAKKGQAMMGITGGIAG